MDPGILLRRRIKLMALLVLAGMLAVCSACASESGYVDPHPHPVGSISIPNAILYMADAVVNDTTELDERVWALLGYVHGLRVIVEGFDGVGVIRASPDSVRFNLHPNARIVGTLHTHPTPANCYPSDKDIHQLQKRGQYATVVACGGGMFGVVFRGDSRYQFFRVGEP